jgi:hypothetical protein
VPALKALVTQLAVPEVTGWAPQLVIVAPADSKFTVPAETVLGATVAVSVAGDP